ncbi:hypothetical protein [Peribacillus sp. SCS-155]
MKLDRLKLTQSAARKEPKAGIQIKSSSRSQRQQMIDFLDKRKKSSAN